MTTKQRIRIAGGVDTPVTKLKDSDGNPRVHSDEQLKALVKSIEKFGFTIPILVDEDYVVLAGHARLAAARSMGLTKVPTIRRTNWSPEQKKAFRIIDNELALMSDWDPDMLADELSTLSDMGVDTTELGFPDIMIGADPVMNPEIPDESERDDDQVQHAVTVMDERDAERRAAPEPTGDCLLYTSPSPRDRQKSRMPSSA